MSKRLNIPSQLMPYGAVGNLLNGALASLSGPIGFSMDQLRLHVKSISVFNPGDEFAEIEF